MERLGFHSSENWINRRGALVWIASDAHNAQFAPHNHRNNQDDVLHSSLQGYRLDRRTGRTVSVRSERVHLFLYWNHGLVRNHVHHHRRVPVRQHWIRTPLAFLDHSVQKLHRGHSRFRVPLLEGDAESFKLRRRARVQERAYIYDFGNLHDLYYFLEVLICLLIGNTSKY